MKPDQITKSIAALGLLNGTIRVVPSQSEADLGRPLFSCAGQLGYIRDARISGRSGLPVEQMTVMEYLAECRFSDAVLSVASTLGDMSLKGPDAYEKVLDDVRQTGTSAMAALEPLDAAWPDAMLAVLPYLSEPGALAKRPYARVFQCQCALSLVSEDGTGMSYEDVQDACREDPGLVIASEPIADGSVQYTGWSTERNGTVSFWCVPVDISQPWTVVSGPGGEMLDPNVRPMRLTAPGMNYYDGSEPAERGWCVVRTSGTGTPSVAMFDSQDDAAAFLMSSFLDANDAAGDGVVPELSHVEPDGSAALLTARTGDMTSWTRWNAVRVEN